MWEGEAGGERSVLPGVHDVRPDGRFCYSIFEGSEDAFVCVWVPDVNADGVFVEIVSDLSAG